METSAADRVREPWNKGKLVGQKTPFKLKEIWAIRIRLQIAHVSKNTFLRGEALSKPPAVRATGVGDVATWSEISQTLSVWQRGYSVRVSVYGPYVTNSLAVAKRLAGIALGHL